MRNVAGLLFLCAAVTLSSISCWKRSVPRDRASAHVYTDSLMLCQQRRKICRGLHGLARIISCNCRFMCSLCSCSNSLLGFLRQLCFGSERGKLSDGIIVRGTIKAYEEFGIGVLFCN